MKSIEYYGTISDAENAGYKTGRQQWHRGYISRKTEITKDTPVYISGDGWLFYNCPSYRSTQYHIRQYFYPRYR